MNREQAVFFAPLLIYFPRFLPGAETQPILAVFLSAWAILFGTKWKIPAQFVALTCVCALIACAQVLTGSSFGGSLALLQLLVGPFCFYGLLAAKVAAPSRRSIALVTFLMVLLATIELLLPAVYETVASALLQRYHVADGIHGITLLTPEPTYASISLVYLLLLSWWARREGQVAHRWIEPAIVILLLLTYSTYAALMIGVLAVARWPRASLVVFGFGILAVPSLSLTALGNEDSIRAVVAISRFLTADFSSLLTSLSVVDESLASRVTTNVASFQVAVTAPLGLGLDCSAVPKAFDMLGYDFAYSNPVLSDVVESGCLKPQSFLAAASLGMGAGAFAFLIAFVYGLIDALRGNSDARIWFPPLAIAMLLLTVQGQITHPVPWFLLYMAVAKRDRIAATESSVGAEAEGGMRFGILGGANP